MYGLSAKAVAGEADIVCFLVGGSGVSDMYVVTDRQLAVRTFITAVLITRNASHFSHVYSYIFS